MIAAMSEVFPEPTLPTRSRSAVFIGYLDYFRARIIGKVEQNSATPTVAVARCRRDGRRWN